MSNYVKCIFVTCLIFLIITICECVRINRLVVPEIVHLGTPVVLDCDYSLDGDEGLVVKWYFNDTSTLIYQWIPNTKPHTLGILKDRVNLDYSASTEKNSVHRALQITHPAPDLTGDYTCVVSTFTGEDRKTKRMLVFAPGKNLDLKQEFRGTNGMKIICSAEAVFPQPSMTIHVNNSEVSTSALLVYKRDGLFDVQIMAEVPLLSAPEKFTCELHIPQANYTIRKEAVYYPVTSSVLPKTSSSFLIFVAIVSTIRL